MTEFQESISQKQDAVDKWASNPGWEIYLTTKIQNFRKIFESIFSRRPKVERVVFLWFSPQLRLSTREIA